MSHLSLNKVFTVAWREFVATVMTKGFLIGLIVPPVIMTVAIGVMPLLLNKKPPTVAGHIAIIDESGVVAPRLQDAFSSEKIQERRNKMMKKAAEEGVKAMGLEGETKKKAEEAFDQAASGKGAMPGGMPMPIMPEVPTLTVKVLDANANLDDAKKPILEATGREQTGTDARLALIHIPATTVKSKELVDGKPSFQKYELFVAPRLDPEVQDDIVDQANRAIVDSRLADAGLNVSDVRAMTERPQVAEMKVTKEGVSKTNKAAAFLVPGGFMFLLWISIFTAAQNLLTSTIEEKGNRVMEVLLSAASPMELMLGKIIGKGVVGGVILLLYGGVGVLSLIFFAMAELVAWQTLALTLVYFLIAYATISCLMAAVGAAVTELSEAQALMTPIMLILIIPMMLWMPILRNPNSEFSVACSFVPLINPFVMVLRISGSEPIPMWQIPVSILVGLITVCIVAWMAAKVFRIGVLMYGKPPDFRTLIRWIRMA